MNAMELKSMLVQETQAKNQSVESAKTALLNTAIGFQTQLTESVQNFRADLRDDLRKAQEEWTKARDAERQQLEEQTHRAHEELTRLRTRLWTWVPILALITVIVSAALTVAVTWWLTSKGTHLAFQDLNRAEGKLLADTRAQVEALHLRLEASKEHLASLGATIEAEEARLKQAEAKQALLVLTGGTNGEIFVQIPQNARPQELNGRIFIEAKLRDLNPTKPSP